MKTCKVKVCGKEVEIRKSRVTAIKAYCMDCSGGEIWEISNCHVKDCPLYSYRGYIRAVKKAINKPRVVRT